MLSLKCKYTYSVVLFVTKINRDPNAATLICGISDYFKETDLICNLQLGIVTVKLIDCRTILEHEKREKS